MAIYVQRAHQLCHLYPTTLALRVNIAKIRRFLIAPRVLITQCKEQQTHLTVCRHPPVITMIKQHQVTIMKIYVHRDTIALLEVLIHTNTNVLRAVSEIWKVPHSHLIVEYVLLVIIAPLKL